MRSCQSKSAPIYVGYLGVQALMHDQDACGSWKCIDANKCNLKRTCLPLLVCRTSWSIELLCRKPDRENQFLKFSLFQSKQNDKSFLFLSPGNYCLYPCFWIVQSRSWDKEMKQKISNNPNRLWTCNVQLQCRKSKSFPYKLCPLTRSIGWWSSISRNWL